MRKSVGPFGLMALVLFVGCSTEKNLGAAKPGAVPAQDEFFGHLGEVKGSAFEVVKQK
jgi:hypothetical protein